MILQSNTSENRFSTLCVYGATGSGKTREVGAMALREWRRHHRKTRLISADGGGWGPLQDYVSAGIIDAINISDAATPLPLLRRLARGDWPSNHTGALAWATRQQQPYWDQVGMYAIEGFASLCSLIIRDSVGKGRKISEEVVGKFTEADEETGEKFSFGAPAKSHYGFVQNILFELIKDFGALTKYGVRQVMYTSLEASGEESVSKKKILGPASAGSAITSALPQRVGDLIHLDIVSVESPGKQPAQEYRAYFTAHADFDMPRLVWPAKMRWSPEAELQLAKHPEFSKGWVKLTNETGIDRKGIGRLFDWRDEIAESGVGKLWEIMKEPPQKKDIEGFPIPGPEEVKALSNKE